MRVSASFRQEVTIDPLDVIEKLIKEVAGYRGWITEEDGKYYRWWEMSAGPHSIDEKEEITKGEYEYYCALKLIETKLKPVKDGK